MKVQSNVIEPVVARPLDGCRKGQHLDAARLGQTDGAEWWHCRRCGEVWNLGGVLKPSSESPERWKR